MPTRLLLEGSDISELLARVRAEHGPTARIVKAEKLRVGGFAGFFAKVRYEMLLEVGGEPEPVADTRAAVKVTPATTAAATATSVNIAAAPARSFTPLAPVAAAQVPAVQVPAVQAPVVAAPVAPVEVPAPTAPPIAAEHTAPAPVAAGPASIEELAELADRADTAELVESGRLRSWPATPVPGSWTDSQQTRAPGRTVSTESDDFAAVLSRLTVDLGADGVDFDSLPPAPVELPADSGPPRGAPVVPGHNPPAFPPAGEPASEEPYEKLRGLGVPAHLAAAVNGEDLYADLVRVFKTLPSAPSIPRRPGDVIVVMGDVASAVPIGRELSKKLRLDPARMLLAAPSTAGTGVPASRRISGPADAQRRAVRMHRDDVPHVVVIDAPIDGDGGEWASDVADAIGATAVWVVVDATRKTADLADHLDRLGPVDALIVQRAGTTRDPAEVLDLRIPVSLVDGRSATPRAWADLIIDRLEADEIRPVKPRRRGRRS